MKVHRFEPQLNSYQKISYINFDLGVGAYYRIYPFRKKENWTRGILIEPSIRYWHDMYSSLTDGKFEYVNDEGENLTHYPYSFELFANISIGYTFVRMK